jgi:hypothetical protein
MSHQDDLLTSAETAALLGIKPNTLEIWRHKGKGPIFQKYGRTPQAPIRYRRSTVMEWLERQSFSSTSGYSPAALSNLKSNNRRSPEASA